MHPAHPRSDFGNNIYIYIFKWGYNNFYAPSKIRTVCKRALKKQGSFSELYTNRAFFHRRPSDSGSILIRVVAMPVPYDRFLPFLFFAHRLAAVRMLDTLS